MTAAIVLFVLVAAQGVAAWRLIDAGLDLWEHEELTRMRRGGYR